MAHPFSPRPEEQKEYLQDRSRVIGVLKEAGELPPQATLEMMARRRLLSRNFKTEMTSPGLKHLSLVDARIPFPHFIEALGAASRVKGSNVRDRALLALFFARGFDTIENFAEHAGSFEKGLKLESRKKQLRNELESSVAEATAKSSPRDFPKKAFDAVQDFRAGVWFNAIENKFPTGERLKTFKPRLGRSTQLDDVKRLLFAEIHSPEASVLGELQLKHLLSSVEEGEEDEITKSRRKLFKLGAFNVPPEHIDKIRKNLAVLRKMRKMNLD
ncbi:MAG: hypothetical protein V1834_04725 [Candidatus Micrarchaeota archaeon]